MKLKGRKQCDEINGCGKFYKFTLVTCPNCGVSDSFSSFTPFNPLYWTYDLETYPNIITFDFKHLATGQRIIFEISDCVNQSVELYNFLMALHESGCFLIGFNNIGFDYPILHFFIKYFHAGITHTDIYNKAQSIIDTPWERRFDNVVYDSDVLIKQIDLFKIHHFDNKSRRTKLKTIEFNLCMDSIEDLPYTPGSILNDVEKNVLIKYNDHDVDATELFLIETLDMIAFREQLGEKHDRNFINHNDKKIGTDLFINEIEANKLGSCYEWIEGRKQKRQTIRNGIILSEIIFPYIHFKELAFNHVLQWLMKQTITKTKGVFEYLDVPSDMAMTMNSDVIKVYNLTASDAPGLTLKTNFEKGVLLSKCKNELINRTDLHRFKFISGWKDQGGLNCVVNGFTFDFGTGGIHGSVDSTIVVSDDDYIIKDWDVGGYYPELGNKNNLFPEHLSNEFCNVDRSLALERKKHKKGTALNRAIKLSRNGAYGDSNNKYSPFYDPQYTMSITINGQLLLCMLAQYLMDIPGLTMIQINTDGLTVRCPRKYEKTMDDICAWWDSYTCLELESVVYSRMFIANVNNYIGEYENGKLKRKGAYAHERIIDNPDTMERQWHQNHSSLVIPKAAEAALVHGQCIEDFIYSHKNIFDFMILAKVGGSEQLTLTVKDNVKQLQKVTRYYVSNSIEAGELKKVSPPAKGHKTGQWKRATKLTDEFYNAVLRELKEMDTTVDIDATGAPWDARINTKNRSRYETRCTGFNVGYLCKVANHIKHATFTDINYEYYIAETKKLVDPLSGVDSR